MVNTRRGTYVVVLSFAAMAAEACIFSIDPLPADDGSTTQDAGRSRFDAVGLDVKAGPIGEGGGFGPADATSDGADPAPDGGADGAVAINLLVNGGFEAASSGGFPCGSPWGMFEGKLTADTTARTGAQACRVCSFSGTPGTSFTINYNSSDAPKTIDAGATLVAQVWARAVPGASTTQKVGITIRIYDGANIVDRADCVAKPLGNAYAPVDCRFTTTKTGVLNVYAQSNAPEANDCFLVDDFSVTVP